MSAFNSISEGGQIPFGMHVLFFLLPGMLGNILHMVVVTRNMWAFAAVPLSVKWFGQNKTWRGFLFLPLSMAFFAGLWSSCILTITDSILSDTLLGMAMGLAYMLAELPNSFVKRRLGIATGQSSERYRMLQLVIDKTDSLIGTCLCYYACTSISAAQMLTIFVLSFALHVGISSLLVQVRLKRAI